MVPSWQNQRIRKKGPLGDAFISCTHSRRTAVSGSSTPACRSVGNHSRGNMYRTIRRALIIAFIPYAVDLSIRALRIGILSALFKPGIILFSLQEFISIEVIGASSYATVGSYLLY